MQFLDDLAEFFLDLCRATGIAWIWEKIADGLRWVLYR